jgi:hypothetical protein
MFETNNVYRWCDDYGGGIVLARNGYEAREKLIKKYGEERGKRGFVIWSWSRDDYFDESNPDVFDIYG